MNGIEPIDLMGEAKVNRLKAKLIMEIAAGVDRVDPRWIAIARGVFEKGEHGLLTLMRRAGDRAPDPIDTKLSGWARVTLENGGYNWMTGKKKQWRRFHGGGVIPPPTARQISAGLRQRVSNLTHSMCPLSRWKGA